LFPSRKLTQNDAVPLLLRHKGADVLAAVLLLHRTVWGLQKLPELNSDLLTILGRDWGIYIFI
jgi:hypothetical protein